ncbi:MAG: thioredoxin domain-containing protein [Sandaracinaceae bacterium]|nr:thioredoxin domain-containing protein [Sandaracinaceae bacterium]
MTTPAHLRVVPVILLGLLSLGASCSGDADDRAGSGGTGSEGSERPPARSRVESLEPVDIGELTGSERRIWVELINDQLSPCGEPISVGRCVAEQRSCRACVPAARYLVRLIQEGYERQEIEALYESRYGASTRVELDIENAPSRGSPMAQVTIVEFSDFECPYCGRAHPMLQQVLREFEGRVRLVFLHFPLSNHPHAMPAARAAVAAGNQGRFWEMHDLLFEHQQQLEPEHLDRYAEELGLDMARFRADLESSRTQGRIEANKEMGRAAGVEGTPAIFVNGRRYREPPQQLAEYLREALDE